VRCGARAPPRPPGTSVEPVRPPVPGIWYRASGRGHSGPGLLAILSPGDRSAAGSWRIGGRRLRSPGHSRHGGAWAESSTLERCGWPACSAVLLAPCRLVRVAGLAQGSPGASLARRRNGRVDPGQGADGPDAWCGPRSNPANDRRPDVVRSWLRLIVPAVRSLAPGALGSAREPRAPGSAAGPDRPEFLGRTCRPARLTGRRPAEPKPCRPRSCRRPAAGAAGLRHDRE